MRATLKDVAKRAGVNFTLVSKLINRNPQARMTPETRARIERAIRELDYRPSAAARSLRTGHSRTIGLLIGNLTNAYCAHFADLVLRETRKLGYQLLIALVEESREKEALSSLFAGEAAGVILLADTYENAGKLRRVPCPAVVCDRNANPFSSVNFMLEKPLSEALEHLELNGVKTVSGLFFGHSLWQEAYRSAAEKTALKADSFPLPFSEEERREKLRKICRKKPDAFLTPGWQTAGMLRELLESEMPGYHPKLILHANCTGPFLADENICGVIHTSSHELIRNMAEILTAQTGKNASPVERKIPARFIPSGNPEYAELITKQFQLT